MNNGISLANVGSNDGLGVAPRWWHCDTHGPGNHTAWGCPECVREMRCELANFRAALALAEAALADIGDADREPGDDLAWAERRAADVLPTVRKLLEIL